MNSAALSLETLFGRLLLEKGNREWRYISPPIGKCSADLLPKYCSPVSLTEFKKSGWGKYQATYLISGGTNACRQIEDWIAAAKAQPGLVAGLKDTQELDIAHLERVSKQPAAVHRTLSITQNESFNPLNARLFIFERNLRLIDTLKVDCDRMTISILLR